MKDKYSYVFEGMKEYVGNMEKSIYSLYVVKYLGEIKVLAEKGSSEIISKYNESIREKDLFQMLFQRRRKKNKNIPHISVLRSMLEPSSYLDLQTQFLFTIGTIVITLLTLWLVSAFVNFDSKRRKTSKFNITSKSGAAMYFVIGLLKLFSSEVFGEALMISAMMREQNGSGIANVLQLAYTLVFPNDCRMFLQVPIYQDGYIYRIDRQKNNNVQVHLPQKPNTLVMPHAQNWRGYVFN